MISGGGHDDIADAAPLDGDCGQDRRRPREEHELRRDTEADTQTGEERSASAAERCQRQRADGEEENLRGPDGVVLERRRCHEEGPQSRDREEHRRFSKERFLQKGSGTNREEKRNDIATETNGIDALRQSPDELLDRCAEELNRRPRIVDVEWRATGQQTQSILHIDHLGVEVKRPEWTRMENRLVAPVG